MNDFNSLFADVANKNQRAFETLYNNTSPKMYALCLHLLHYDKESAEDVLQEAYIKIWDKADKYSPGKGTPITWMSTVVRNQAFDRLRSYKVRPKLTEELAYENMEYASNELAYIERKTHSEQLAFFKKVLETLPEIQQRAITQSLVYGYTHTEISEGLEVPLGTVKAWLRRSLPTIKTKMLDYKKTVM